MLNSTQIELFKNLSKEVKISSVDIKKIDEIKNLPYFKIWKQVVQQLYKKHLIPDENKTLDQTIDIAIQDMLIEYFNRCPQTFQKKIIQNMFECYLEYLTNDQKNYFYFSPLYNFEFDSDEIKLNESIKIRKISENEKKFLLNFYENFSPVKVSINKIKFVFVLKINEKDLESIRPDEELFYMINKLKIINNGDIFQGGLYNFDKSDYWNPKNKIFRIKVEPIGILSTSKYRLHKRHVDKFKELIKKMSVQYPNKNKNKEELYDVLTRTINRFGSGLEKNNIDEKIVDLVLCLEILLVSASYNSTMKISQRSAMFLGKNVKERLYILEKMVEFYDFRSGQVHESLSRPVKNLSKEFVLKQLEFWTRRAILQLMFFSQDKKFSKLTYRQLLRKIDNSAYDPKVNRTLLDLSNEIIKLLKF